IPIQHVYHVYFFGHRNSITPVAILLLTICAIYYHIQKKRLSLWMLIVVTSTILGMLFIWSATGVAVMFIFILLILFINNGVLFKFMNFAAFAPITIGSFFFVVVFRLQEHISFLIEQILDRSLTFTGRTIIWDFSIMMISQAPFLGYGVRQSSDPTWLGWSSTYLWFSHNGVLEILLRGGFIGLITYIVLVVYVIVSLLKHRANPIAALLSAGIFAFFISMLMESSFKSVYLFATFAFAFYVDKIIETTEEAPLVEELQESKYIISKMHNKSIYIR
ncbi:MAG: O-antigen ligase family protein, partial [Defluviitaleaceae bacterium]|nr:O-antigen ligase family protein [Defluviitaleaceae bacterium]